jgi:hypothetical protein
MAVPLMSARRPTAFDDVFRMGILERRYCRDPGAVARQFAFIRWTLVGFRKDLRLRYSVCTKPFRILLLAHAGESG